MRAPSASRSLLRALVLGALVTLAARPSLARARAEEPPSAHEQDGCTAKSVLPGCTHARLGTTLQPYSPRTRTDRGLVDVMTPAGQKARGLYITPAYLFRFGAERTAAMVKRAHLDAVVIDMKSDEGNLLYPTRIPLAQAQRLVLWRDPAAMVKAFHDQGVYVIGRVVTFKDSRLPLARPDLAVRMGRNASRLFSAGAKWLDAYSPEVRDYLVDIAVEIQSLGFDEVQFDYVRFPKGHAGTLGVWLHRTPDSPDRATLVARFLEEIDRAVTIPISADVFGLTTLVDGDPRELGQSIERMAEYIEAISPMMYANGMDTYFRDNRVTEAVHDLIQCGLRRARAKAPHLALRPYLQAYANSVEHMWGPEFVQRQILASERAGSDGYLLWNPTMRNQISFRALADLSKRRPDAAAAPRTSPLAWCPTTGNVFDKPVQGTRAPRRASQATARHLTSVAQRP